MFAFDGIPGLAKAHAAVIHAPLGAAIFLPVSLALALLIPRRREAWLHTSAFLAGLALAGGLAATASGWIWGRELGGILPGQWLAHPRHPAPSFVALLRTHQLLALSGIPVGLVCGAMVVRARRGRPPHLALALSLLWLGLWGAAGHWGGRMVFPDTPVDENRP